ncbi:PglZ domain-containing protein [Amycolatopsis lurida]|uniref:Alkaline phosphatase n=1 Tax=Amycolatopsis lurida NRRL 2430 TaxID=1460371 RepID=A0A2P2FZ08_AMYLU|nr:BREX-2 system phosphatase PglZ [Amycolatopsis lurida]KFU81957.1 alkaline phosphatase [Amycolatopsis lurida NRRL 2430]SEC39403.1 PglZ domain-containing protein [Amycolatopsis lurida]
MAAVPELNRRVIEALLQSELPSAPERRLVLVHGRYDALSPAEFNLKLAGATRRVHVTDQPSVLGIAEAWQHHQKALPSSDDVLVVTTAVDDAHLGWDLRAYALRRGIRSVDRAEIVKQRFGAADIDPRIRREPWLVDALLDAEPTSGWRRSGSVLTRDAAVRALIGARLGGDELGEGTLDMDGLLAWSQRAGGPERFAELPPAEQDGLTNWLGDVIGGAATVVLGLARIGRAADAMALGVIGTVTTGPMASADSAVAFGALLGGPQFSGAHRRAFIEAVEGTLERWVAEAENSGPSAGHARSRVVDLVRRADDLAAGTELAEALAENRFVPTGLQARLRSLATALSGAPTIRSVAAAEAALVSVRGHALARLYPERLLAAEMAVRVQRWLAAPVPTIESVASGIDAQFADWGWVDRALSALWLGDSSADLIISRAYRAVYKAGVARRDSLDETFAQRLSLWTTGATTQAPGGCLLIEDVMDTIARPLLTGQAPLIIVLDGMSSAVAVELAEQLAGRTWTEASPKAGRRSAAVAAIPSVTRASRASLLTGGLTTGDQATEKDGFASLWRKHHRDGALFHKGEIAGQAGHRLSEPLITALAEDVVVGVVLNTIDDALDHGREGDRVGWRPADITYLPELLDAARSYRRPVVLVSDHGHVLERSASGEGPLSAEGVESARWRTGTAGFGEVELAGPRVLYGNGRVVAPWNASIRYTPRKSGYHGGASLAEMTVPVLVLLPSAELLPKGWSVLPPESTAPLWWAQRRAEETTTSRAPSRRATTKPKPASPASLFEVEVGTPKSLGALVVETDLYTTQRAFVRKPPNKSDIAAVIDALVAADNTISLTAAAAAGGRAGRSPEGFATILQRLLNVEGYPVLSVVDGGQNLRLNLELLRVQFKIGSA